MAEDNIVVKTIEDVDKLFSQIVINGEVFESERYVEPEPKPVVVKKASVKKAEVTRNTVQTEPQNTTRNENTRSIQGENVYAVELNDILHNFEDRAIVQALSEEAQTRAEADEHLQQSITDINSKIPSTASSSNKLADSASVGTSINNAIEALDVASAGGNGKYIKSISETDGKISATTGNIDSSVNEGSSNPVTGGAVHSAIQAGGADAQQAIDSAIATEVENRNSAISNAIDTEVSNRNTAISNAIDTEVSNRNTAISNAVEALDVASAGGNGKYIKAISETDGKISATTGNIDSSVTAGSPNPVTGGAVDTAINVVKASVEDIEALIPNQATASNQLADKAFVNSSIATNTANFLGTYTSLAQIQAIPNPTNNDYAYLQTTDSAGNTLYQRYKYSSSDSQWHYEYTLNNSSFTAEQWATINSGLTQASVTAEIGEAISGEVTARNSAISNAIDTEVANRNTAISNAIDTEVSNRNTVISNAIEALDVASAGGNGKYIKSISETNGKISATTGDIDSSVTSGSSNPVTGGAVATALSDKVDKVTGKGLSTNDFTDALKNKLNGIEAGAQVNTVTGVKGSAETDYRTGDISISKSNIGLGNVVNTGDSAVPAEGGTDKFTTGGAYTELAKKQDNLTFDNFPTKNSNNPVTSEGIAKAINYPQVYTYSNNTANNVIIHLGSFTSNYDNRLGLSIVMESQRVDRTDKFIATVNANRLYKLDLGRTNYGDILLYQTDTTHFDLYAIIGSYVTNCFISITSPINFTYDGSVVTTYNGTKIEPITYMNSQTAIQQLVIESTGGVTKYYKLINTKYSKVSNVYVGNRYAEQFLIRPSSSGYATDILRFNTYTTAYGVIGCKMGAENNLGVFLMKVVSYNPIIITNLENQVYSPLALEEITQTEYDNASSSTLSYYREYLDIKYAPTVNPTSQVSADNLDLITSGGVYNEFIKYLKGDLSQETLFTGDLNDIQYGNYFISSVSTNSPPQENSAGFLMALYRSSVYQEQLAFFPTTRNIYSRACFNGAWSSWNSLKNTFVDKYSYYRSSAVTDPVYLKLYEQTLVNTAYFSYPIHLQGECGLINNDIKTPFDIIIDFRTASATFNGMIHGYASNNMGNYIDIIPTWDNNTNTLRVYVAVKTRYAFIRLQSSVPLLSPTEESNMTGVAGTSMFNRIISVVTLQPKALSSPITVGGAQQTTVEKALGALAQASSADSTPVGTVIRKCGALPAGYINCGKTEVEKLEQLSSEQIISNRYYIMQAVDGTMYVTNKTSTDGNIFLQSHRSFTDFIQTADKSILAVSGSSLYKSVDGIAFTAIFSDSNSQIFRSVIQSKDGSIYVTADTGIFKSSDNGSSFTKVLDSVSITCLVQASNGTMYAGALASNKGLYKSTDGETFTRIYSTHNVRCVLVLDDNTIYIGTDYGVYKTTDETNFESVGLNKDTFCLYQAKSGVIFAGTGSQSAVYKSIDGNNFTQLIATSSTVYDLIQTKDGTIYVLTSTGLFKFIPYKELDKTTYADLYAVVGDKYNLRAQVSDNTKFAIPLIGDDDLTYGIKY